MSHAFQAGSTGPVSFDEAGMETLASLSFDQLAAASIVSIRRIAADPGGADPGGIARVSSAQYWIVDAAPSSSSSSGNFTIAYGELSGISEPSALRLLRRSGPQSTWEVAPSSVNTVDETVSTAFGDLTGEWTLGSTSGANTLTPQFPGMASNPQPADGAAAVQLDQSLSWAPAEFARTYDLYLWSDEESEPTKPTKSGLTEPTVSAIDLALVRNAAYSWYVISRNLDGDMRSPTWSFTTELPSDLEISDVIAPSSGFSGREIDLKWTVTNVGNVATDSPQWFDEVRLAHDPSFLVERHTLGTFENPSSLAPGEQYVQEVTVTLPEETIGIYYLRLDVNLGEHQQEETFDNNHSVATIEIQLSPAPDLHATAITVPGNAFSGTEVEVGWTVENTGNGPAVADYGWQDDVYLSPSPALDKETATFLRRLVHPDAVDAGGSYTASVPVVIPPRLSGDYYLIVWVDAGRAVYEHEAEDNNQSASDPVTITLLPPPDLAPTSFTGPESAASGEKIGVAWKVGNAGPGAVESAGWQDRVLLTGGDLENPVVLGNVARTGSLGVDTSYVSSDSVRIPDGLDGEYRLALETDWADAIFEHDFENNNVTDRTIAITRAPYPDLAVQNVKIEGPSRAGADIRVSWKERNVGTAAPAAGWSDRVYLSSKTELDTTAIPLTSIPSGELPAPGGSYSRAVSVRLPADRDGQLFLLVVADADRVLFEYPDDEGNNVGSATLDVNPYPPVDLAVVDATAPSEATGGEKFTVGWTVENMGEAAPAVPVWDDLVYLSADERFDPKADPLLARVPRTEGLAAGESYRRSVDVTLPDGVSGAFNVLIYSDVADSHADNNVGSPDHPINASSGPLPDLVSGDFSVPSEASAGQSINVTWPIRNDGVAPADGKWFDAVYISPDKQKNAGDFLVGGLKREGPLSPGEAYQQELDVPIPYFASGNYYLLFSVDDQHNVYEGSGEGENVVASPLQIRLPLPSDLVVTQVNVPATAMPGEDATVSWTLVNQGQNPAQGILRNAVYVSTDDAWQVTDPLLGSELQLIDLAPGESMSLSERFDLSKAYLADAEANITGELPGVAPGSYRAIVRADVQNNIRETAEDNNATASAATMEADVPLLPLGGSVQGTLAPQQSRYYKIDLPDGVETFDLMLESSSATAGNELYVSGGRVPGRADADVKSQDPFASSFTLSVPRQATDDSTYYVLLYEREGETDAQSYTLSADDVRFELDEIDLMEGGRGGDVTVRMTGASFGPRTRALLENESTKIPATVVRQSTVEAYATFDLSQAPLGTFDFVAERDESYINLDADSVRIDTNIVRSILPAAFRVVPKASAEPDFEVKVPDAVRTDQEFAVSLEITNRGNNDLVSPLVVFWTSPAIRSTLHSDEDETAGYKRVLLVGPGPIAGILRPGETHRALISLTSPSEVTKLSVYAVPAVGSGATFDLDVELREAMLDSEALTWDGAVEDLRQEVDPRGWAGYQSMLAQTASRLSQQGLVVRDASRLLLQLLRDIDQERTAPPYAGEPIPNSGVGKGEETMDPCDHFGSVPQGKDCSPLQIAADKATLACIAAAMAAPQICGAVHGAEHLVHFVEGDGSPIMYDNNSSVAAKLRAHDGAYKSYKDINQQTSQEISKKMTDQIRQAGCSMTGSVNPNGDLGDLGITVPKPNTYLHKTSAGIPYYNPFTDELPSLSDLRVEQPGCDLVTAFGGFQSASGLITNFRTHSIPDPNNDACVPGCTIVWEATLTYEFGDKYEFDEHDAGGAYDARGRNLQLCGEAKPYQTYVFLKEPIGGIVRVPPKQKKCKRPKPPELPPFVFAPPKIVPVLTSKDPNDLVGPAGFGDKRWVSVSAQLPYKIRFENDPDQATAPAQVVSIEQDLPDSTLDIRSFRLGRFGFGGFKFDPPANVAAYVDRLDLTDSLGIFVDVNAGLDVENKRAFWILRSIDPATGSAPASPLKGFLPVDDSLGSGEGFVSYTIRPNPQSHTGDVILAKADIVFDNNGVIGTPEAFNTIDAGLPSSRVTDTAFRQDSTIFDVRWTGTDDALGSGIGTYDLYVSKDGGPFEAYRRDLDGSSVLFNAEWDHRYQFYTLSSDRAGNLEPSKTEGDALVVVSVDDEAAEVPKEFALEQNYPNPFNPSTTVAYALPRASDVELTVYTALGQRVVRYKIGPQQAGIHRQRLDMGMYASGVYFYELRAREAGRDVFREVKKLVLVK